MKNRICKFTIASGQTVTGYCFVHNGVAFGIRNIYADANRKLESARTGEVIELRKPVWALYALKTGDRIAVDDDIEALKACVRNSATMLVIKMAIANAENLNPQIKLPRMEIKLPLWKRLFA